MVRVVLEIDNKQAHGISPREYLKRYVLQENVELEQENHKIMVLESYYWKIKVKSIKQD